MRLASSASMSIARDPSGLGGLIITVGNDISSATKGSGVRIVEGKKRSPAKPWATALLACVMINEVATANPVRRRQVRRSIELFLIREEQRSAAVASASTPIAHRSKGGGVKLLPVGCGREPLLGTEFGYRRAAD